jgi:hypothetical protein
VDRVLVISAGRIHEEGSPADLLTSGGLYADLYARQFGEAAAAASAAEDRAAEPTPAEPGLGSEPDLVEAADLVEASERFDTALTRALPRPATKQEFLALTGWIPTVSLPSPGDDGMDPLRSPALIRTLPGLAEALNASAMAPRLQRMLADDVELLACSPAKAFVQPGVGATLQYRLELRRRGTGETVAHVVAGRLFPTVEAAEGWLSDVDALTGQVAGRADLRAFARPALLVPELRLVLHAFPLDPALPGLVRASDPAELVGTLGPLLESSVPGLHLQDCHAEVVRYRQGSCVLRYELAWHLQPSRRSLKQVVYGKVYGDDRGQLVGPAVTALRERMDGGAGSLPFLVPRFQGYLPDLRLALLEAVPGSALLPSMIRASGMSGGPGVPGPSPDEAVMACARIAAALHRSSIPVGEPRTLAEEVDGAREAVEALAPLAPALALRLHGSLGAVGDLVADRPGPLGAAHGDFDHSQVLFDGPTTSLVDFDAVCRAEPALDLGSFTGRLAVAVRRAPDAARAAHDGGDDLADAFLREYVRVRGSKDPALLLARVEAYRTVALVRLAVRSWCQLKPQRLRPALALLEKPPRIRSLVP